VSLSFSLQLLFEIVFIPKCYRCVHKSMHFFMYSIRYRCQNPTKTGNVSTQVNKTANITLQENTFRDSRVLTWLRDREIQRRK
jgi:hypothetical protein